MLLALDQNGDGLAQEGIHFLNPLVCQYVAMECGSKTKNVMTAIYFLAKQLHFFQTEMVATLTAKLKV